VTRRRTPLTASLLLEGNIKRTNIGVMLRSAGAFGFENVFCVVPENPRWGRIGNDKAFCRGNGDCMNWKEFREMWQVREFCDENEIEIIGVEIMEDSEPLQEVKFSPRTLFAFGNEQHGLSEEALKICDRVIHIDQFGGFAPCLSVSHSASITMYAWSLQSGQKPLCKRGGKFLTSKILGKEKIG